MVVRSCISVEKLRFSVYTKRTKPPPLEHKLSHDIPLAFWINPGGGFISFTLFPAPPQPLKQGGVKNEEMINDDDFEMIETD